MRSPWAAHADSSASTRARDASFGCVGPEEIRAQAAGAAAGAAILSPADVRAWLRVHLAEDAGGHVRRRFVGHAPARAEADRARRLRGGKASPRGGRARLVGERRGHGGDQQLHRVLPGRRLLSGGSASPGARRGSGPAVVHVPGALSALPAVWSKEPRQGRVVLLRARRLRATRCLELRRTRVAAGRRAATLANAMWERFHLLARPSGDTLLRVWLRDALRWLGFNVRRRCSWFRRSRPAAVWTTAR